MADEAPQEPQETQASQNLNGYLNSAMQVANRLSPEDRKQFLQMVFTQRVMPSQEFQDMFPSAVHAKQFLNQFGVPTEEIEKHYPQLQTWNPPSFAERVAGSYINPMTLNPFSHAYNALNAIGTPGRLVRESVNAASEAMGNKPPNRDPGPMGAALAQGDLMGAGRALASPGGLREFIPQNAGDWSEQLLYPKAMQAAMATVKSPMMLMRVMQKIDQDIKAGKAAAASENAAFYQPKRPLALPPIGGTTETTRLPTPSPYPMPGRLYSPAELREIGPYVGTRPPSLMPQPKATPQPQQQLKPVKGPSGETWYAPGD